MYTHTPGHSSTADERPGIGQNMSCALSDWLPSTCRSGACLQPREFWFSDITCILYVSEQLKTWTVLKPSDGFKAGRMVLKRAGGFKMVLNIIYMYKLILYKTSLP